MSGLFDYNVAEQIAATDPPFDALIMAAFLKADPSNRERLGSVFTELHDETFSRYHAVGGRLIGE